MPFKIPENITELTDEDLSKHSASAVEAAEKLAAIDDDKLTDEQIAELEAIVQFNEAASAESAGRVEAAEARTAKIAALRDASKAKKDEDEAPVEDKDEAPVVDEDAPPFPVENDDEDEKEKEKEKNKTNSIQEEAPVVDADADTEVGEPVAVAASASKNKSTASRAAAAAPKHQNAAAANPISMVAAADVPGFASGAKFGTLSEAGSAIMARLKSLPSGSNGQKFKTRAGAVVFNMGEGKLSQNDYRNDSELLAAASNESRLEGGNLVAAGGWGAPSEQVLDFCSIEVADGLLDLSEITLTRGGLSYTKGPSFEDVLASATGFWDQTEATAEAGSELKTSLRPKTPDFIEARLDAVGVMVEAGLLLRSAWPELVERYASMALLAHQMKMSAKALAGIREFTGPAKDITGGFGNELDILNVLILASQGERQRFAMARNATLEVLLADWVKSAVKAGLANRTGVDFLSVTDAQVEQWFSSQNLRVQWLRGFQPLEIDETADVATQYPATVETIMYPAGTYVKGVSDVLTLDTVYDSVNLKKNDYVHLFVEQGLTVVNPCNTGRNLSVPLHINGRTSAADITADAFGAPALP